MFCDSIKVLLFLSVVLLHSSVLADTEDDGRVVNGEMANVANVPFVVQLRRDGATYCGGTVISPIHVLTAAHCVDSGTDNVRVVANANTIFDQGISRSIVDQWISNEYTRKTLQHDFAILKLDSPLENIKTPPICSKSWSAGDRVRLFGWGKLTEGGRRSRNLRTVELTMISRKECLQKNDLLPVQNDSRECAFESGQDACQGDSGGPAMVNGELCGVISAGAGCADERYPGLYTSVYTIRSLIQKAMKAM